MTSYQAYYLYKILIIPQQIQQMGCMNSQEKPKGQASNTGRAEGRQAEKEGGHGKVEKRESDALNELPEQLNEKSNVNKKKR